MAGAVGEDQQSQLDTFNDYATGWIALIVIACALMAVAVLVFAKVGPGTRLTRREKTLRILVIAAVALADHHRAVRERQPVPGSVPRLALLIACWAMFLARWIAPQVGDATDYVGARLQRGEARGGARAGASQEAQSERGEALEDVLEDMVEERGDTELVEEAENGEE